uniref:AMP-dependent synthetase/ligase domain-containing protein n=1 Tax=Salix viminalis TaxID=40686 RepID=A0A6N2LDK7_SALVM
MQAIGDRRKHTKDRPVRSTPLTPIAFLERAAIAYADCPSIIYNDTTYTWSQTNRRCLLVASSLPSYGIEVGHVVSVLPPNVPATHELHFAVPMAADADAEQPSSIDTVSPDVEPLRNPVHIITAGAPPPEAVILRTESLGFVVSHGYGLTETAGLVVSCAWKQKWNTFPASERARLKARQGVTMAGLTEMDVVNPSTAGRERETRWGFSRGSSFKRWVLNARLFEGSIGHVKMHERRLVLHGRCGFHAP